MHVAQEFRSAYAAASTLAHTVLVRQLQSCSYACAACTCCDMVLLMKSHARRYFSVAVTSLESVQSVAEYQCTDVSTTVWLDVLHTVAAAEASLSRGTGASQGICTTIILHISIHRFVSRICRLCSVHICAY
jgi:hypothetical protein